MTARICHFLVCANALERLLIRLAKAIWCRTTGQTAFSLSTSIFCPAIDVKFVL